ncbi:MAG: polysaccharide biosynthesis/export family protein [Nitrospiria bacterium]
MKTIIYTLLILGFLLLITGKSKILADEQLKILRNPPQSVQNRAKTVKSNPNKEQVNPLLPDFPSPFYLLGPEDVLKISIWKDESLTSEALVRPDGNISFPLIGEVVAAGRTVEELKKEIISKISPFVPDPTLSVEVLKVNSYKIYVVGKVAKPGEYIVGHYPDIMQALSLAGGLTPFASENNIKILRRDQGKEYAHLFRYGDVKNGIALDQNMILKPGDVVVVP